MNRFRYVAKSLRFYWRTHLGVLLGTALGSMILAGALVVGDSIRFSLRSLAVSRLGGIEHALSTPNRFFRPHLAGDISEASGAATCSMLVLSGSASTPGGTTRANNIQILGVTTDFWKFYNTSPPFSDSLNESVVINSYLAERLDLKKGGRMVLRIEKPGLLPRDSIMATDTDAFTARSFTIDSVVSNNTFGRFSLKANQVPPFNIFLPINTLQQLVALKNKANMILAGNGTGKQTDAAMLDDLLRNELKLADAGLVLKPHKSKNVIELTSDRIFIEEHIIDAVNKHAAPLTPAGFLTYLVNTIKPAGTETSRRYTPYSFVTATGPLHPDAPRNTPALFPGLFPVGGDSEKKIAVSPWLASDLNVREGDTLSLTYFVSGSKQALKEETGNFTVCSVLKENHPALDRTLMPRYPGLSDVEDCRNWNAGFPIDLSLIREKDETYWDVYKGTPKAFITLAAGQKLWANRFGGVTAIRFPYTENQPAIRDAIRHTVLQNIDPAGLGFFFQPVRSNALKASRQAMDFGHLFLGLSFFLLVSALLLVGLLFVFGIEQRTGETGLLLATGIPHRNIRTLFLIEGLLLAVSGSAAGLLLGALYAKTVLYALSTLWIGAVGTSSVQYHATFSSFFTGWLSSIFMAVFAMWFTLRRQSRQTARELLSLGKSFETETGGKAGGILRSRSLYFGLFSTAGACIIIFLAGEGQAKQQTGAFFAAGSLLLAGTLAISHTLLGSLHPGREDPGMSTVSFAFSNCARRRFRSLAVVGLLATGTFMIIAVSANRRDPFSGARLNTSGTGGFEIFADATIALHNNPEERGHLISYGVPEETADKVDLVSIRIREGSDASCMNLNRVQQPQILGVTPDDFISRNAFTFVDTMEGIQPGTGWEVLNNDSGSDIITAVGDAATITWGLGKSPGDTITYTDEHGTPFKVQIAGIIARSVFQGNLLISEKNFIDRFPSESGFRMFLGDVKGSDAEISSVSDSLSRALGDRGLAVIAAEKKLASFNIVENTYLSIFQALGGLGLLLGSAGLAVVVIRNILERRHEFALLRALGFTRGSIRMLVLCEHWALVLLGLFCGTASAVVAVLPALRSPDLNTPWFSLLGLLVLVLASSLFWTAAAAFIALRGPMLDALRNE